MIGLSFLSQALLWGMLLAAVPIIIHLLYRRRFLRIEWAPMEYLKLSIKRNRRRIRVEQLILLAMRVLAVLLLFFLVARPVMQAQGLGAWLGGRSRTSQILLIDDSLSMGYSEGGRTAFDRAKELAGEVLKSVGNQDRFSLVTATRPKSPELREVEVGDREKTTQQIARLALSDAFTAWDATLKAVDELIKSSTYPIREVTIITDLRRAGWDGRITETANRWASERDRVRLRVFDVGTDRTDNLTLESLEQIDRVALVATPTKFEAVIHNNRATEADQLDATFTVDAKPSVVRLPTIPAGSTARVPLTAIFQDAGTHHVSLKLPDDDLRGDNERWVVTEVRDQLRIQLVDGEPSNDPLAGEVDFLAIALSLGLGDSDAWQVDIVTDSQWASSPLARPDMLVLANVASLRNDRARELQRQVEDGMGLMIFVGDQIDPDNYNQTLHRDGAGLMPGRLEAVMEDEATGLALEDVERSPLEALTQLNPAVLQRLKVKKFYSLKNTGDEPAEVKVLARWNNAAAAPAAIVKNVGRGRVLLWTVTADKAWSDWPTDPSYVMAVREATKAIARGDSGSRTLTAGDAIRRTLPPRQQAGAPMIETPGAEAPVALEIEQEQSADASMPDPPKTLIHRGTAQAGLYRLSWRDSSDAAQHDTFSVNPDRRESELVRITSEDLRRLFGSLQPDVISGVTRSDTAIAVRGQEVWRTLAVCLFALLAIEACFATWAGRQR